MRAYILVADKKFAEIAAAQAARIARLTQDDVHVFLEGLGEGSRFREFSSPSIHYHYDRLANFLPPGLPETSRFPKITYYRIIAPLLLGEYQRVVYLDSDVCFLRPDDAIWEVDLPHGIGAVHDLCLVGDLTAHRDRPKRDWLDSLGIRSSRYFNAGVLAIEPKKWAQADLISRLASFAVKYGKAITFMDQDFLNYEFQDRWTELSPRFNFQFPIHGLGYAESLKPALIHFNITDRPWLGLWRSKFTPLGKSFDQIYAESLEEAGYSIKDVRRGQGKWNNLRRMPAHVRRRLRESGVPAICFPIALHRHHRSLNEIRRFFQEAHTNRRFADLHGRIEPVSGPLVYCGRRFEVNESGYWDRFASPDQKPMQVSSRDKERPDGATSRQTREPIHKTTYATS